MRIYLLLLSIITLLASCGAHQKKGFKYDLPNNAISLTVEEYALTKDFQSNPICSGYKEFYQIDSILVAFDDVKNGRFGENILLESKRIMNTLFHDPSISPNGYENYTSRIEKFKNNQALIQKYDSTIYNKSYYQFQIVNNDFTKIKSGIIVFSKTDNKKANSILINLLKNFQF
jgi:hypothetical protein